MSNRALTFGEMAEAYERFRPGYPQELSDAVTTYAGRPIRTALEIGAGTGKATRLFAQLPDITITTTEPDDAMLAELRKHAPRNVKTSRAAFEDLDEGRYDLVYAAAALHWTSPEGRWSRMAALCEPGSVFASFAGPIQPEDPEVAGAIHEARLPYLESDEIPSPDGTPAHHDMQWPGTELQRSEWFEDVRQEQIERRLRMTAEDFVGHLSTVSAYLVLPADDRERVFERIRNVLPSTIDITADLTLHLARRTRDS